MCLAAQAGNLTRARELIRRGADVHHINLNGDNALTLAATGGHLTFIEWLDSHCPQSVDHENYYGETPLTLAAKGRRNAIFRWLIRSRRLDNRQANDLLLHALHSGHRSLAAWLCLNVCNCICGADNENHNALMLAAKCGFLWLTQWLSD